ncbi:MAG TPA: glycosyltransferase [Opitutus sp.]|nr:glycosyltransferase [Opitutus sp.]
MKIRLFYHSLVSDWNHGNAHFLRGIAGELVRRGHEVIVYEPSDGWSFENLVDKHGLEPLARFHEAYPDLVNRCYDSRAFDAGAMVGDADLVIVHEWSDPALVKAIGRVRQRRSFVLLFHDTHHRLATQPETMRNYDLSAYDGVLAYGRVLRDQYLREGLTDRAWTWHEAADTAVFKPQPQAEKEGDLVWIGNWGDDERAEEIHEFLIEPVRALGLKACVYGVRYPEHARQTLARAGIAYRGWLPNFRVPEIYARYQVTVHISRRPYVRALPGIPTIRPFEAMACGIPLVCSPWSDAEGLFAPGDFLSARDGAGMRRHLQRLIGRPALRQRQAKRALATIRRRHTCAHRVDELLDIYAAVAAGDSAAPPGGARRLSGPSELTEESA